MTQRTFDDLARPEERRDAALATAEHNAEPRAIDRATEIVHQIALHQPTLTAEDVTAGVREAGIFLHEPRAVANALLKAKVHGWISPTREFVTCTRPERHAGTQRVWRSRVRKEQP